MKEVYIVTSGDYSDYSIRQVFDDKEIAEEFAAQIRGAVKVFKITNELKHTKGTRAYLVYIKKDGHILRVFPTKIDTRNDFGCNKCLSIYDQGGCSIYILTDQGREGAIKIANEKRAMAIANNEWPE